MPLNIQLAISIVILSVKARGGGKPAARRLRKPVTSKKRAAFLRWFLDDPDGRTVGACMAYFRISRANVFTYWTTIHREHGIGYALGNNTITARLPRDVSSDSIFGDAHA